MAASLVSCSTGQLRPGACSFSSSFLSPSKRSAGWSNASTSGSSISGGRVSGGKRGREFTGARCRTMSLELEAPPSAETTLYGLLGLEQGVGLHDIKSSYRRLARRYHPDVCVPEEREECTKMFMQVQDAYEVLSDPVRREKYDYQLMNPLSSSSVGWGSMVRRSRQSETGSAEWGSRWRDQLAGIHTKPRATDSWAAKLRAKRAAC